MTEQSDGDYTITYILIYNVTSKINEVPQSYHRQTTSPLFQILEYLEYNNNLGEF
jgi:hypothetical protein